MDPSNRMLFAIILFACATGMVVVAFAYPAYYRFLPHWLARATRIACLLFAAGLAANGIYALRGGLPIITLEAVVVLMLITVFALRPWTVRYYREERARELEALRLRK
jgi:hypothetical protein